LYAPAADFEPRQIAQFYFSIYQGALMMAKVSGSNELLAENIAQFRQYLMVLFGRTDKKAGAVSRN
jgi:hypothetical protein